MLVNVVYLSVLKLFVAKEGLLCLDIFERAPIRPPEACFPGEYSALSEEGGAPVRCTPITSRADPTLQFYSFYIQSALTAPCFPTFALIASKLILFIIVSVCKVTEVETATPTATSDRSCVSTSTSPTESTRTVTSSLSPTSTASSTISMHTSTTSDITFGREQYCKKGLEDRIYCSPLQICSDDEVEIVSPTLSTDRVCESTVTICYPDEVRPRFDPPLPDNCRFDLSLRHFAGASTRDSPGCSCSKASGETNGYKGPKSADECAQLVCGSWDLRSCYWFGREVASSKVGSKGKNESGSLTLFLIGPRKNLCPFRCDLGTSYSISKFGEHDPECLPIPLSPPPPYSCIGTTTTSKWIGIDKMLSCPNYNLIERGYISGPQTSSPRCSCVKPDGTINNYRGPVQRWQCAQLICLTNINNGMQLFESCYWDAVLITAGLWRYDAWNRPVITLTSQDPIEALCTSPLNSSQCTPSQIESSSPTLTTERVCVDRPTCQISMISTDPAKFTPVSLVLLYVLLQPDVFKSVNTHLFTNIEIS